MMVPTVLHAAAGVTLVQNGQARAVVVLPADADKDEQLAAQELCDHVALMSGVKLEVVASRPDSDKPAVLIGRAADAALDELVRKTGSDPASFALVVDGQTVAVRGLSSEGTLFGVYELLERLGVRWYIPGELGTVIPTTRSIQLDAMTVVQAPSFAARWQASGRYQSKYPAARQWARRMRMGGPMFPSSHGIPLPKAATVEAEPELYALVAGKRVKSQVCVTNPRVLELAIAEVKKALAGDPTQPWIGMGPNDGGGFCECPNCTALDGGDWDPFSNEHCVTDRYVWFFNQMLKGIEDEYPDKRIGFYVYHTYMRPPVKVKPDPRIMPALAPIALCRVHGPENPVCPEASYYGWLAQEWVKLLPQVYDRGYWFNLADPGMTFPMMHRLRRQIPLARELGIYGWRVETVASWASESPSLYVASKLMWDHTADVDALVRDFTDRFFGPASEPMHGYFTLLDAALRDSDHHTGCAFDAPLHYPAELRSKARTFIDAARAAAGPADGVHARRIEIFAKQQAYLDAFVTMLESRAKHDFATAKKSLDDIDAIREDLLKYDPPMLNPWAAGPYLKRFFRTCTEQGYARTTAGNEVVAPLADRWQFQIDPQRIGEDIGLWRPQSAGGNWQPILTSSSSWSNQGLRYYKGQAWYRQTVTIDKKYAGKRVFLWFGGADEKAKVWVNGKVVGISHSSSFIPFEFDVTEAIVPGGDNVVVACVLNQQVDELGTGGIMAPAMFYAPAAGKDAVVENVKEPGRTFP